MSQAIRATAAPTPRGYYSQGVKAGNLLFISGQLPFDTAGNLVGKNVTEQTNQTLTNVRAILEAAGGTLDNLVQVTIYVSDIAHWPAVNAAYQAFLSQVKVPPARAVVPVKDLHYGAQLEIQAIASFD